MKRILGGFLVLGLLIAFGAPAFAEYPDRPITLIANYSAGGGADLSARALAKKAEKALGQPIAVVNRVGAGGTVGMAAIAASKPDGYTIGVTTYGPLTFAPHMNDLPYNALTDFEYIMGYGRYMYGPVARADSQLKTLKDLVQYAKANPGKVKYSLIGLPTPNNFGMVYLAKAEGLKWEPVVFKETPAAVAACMGGHVDIVSQNPGDVVSYIKAGRLRLLASFSDIRWPWIPDVPTAKELGYKFDVNSWLAMGTPKGVPKPAMDKLRDAFKKAMDDPEFLEIMNKIFIPPAYKTPEEYKSMVEVGYKESEAMIRELGLHKSQQKK
jgi:tripartite-type tricarboxylate transporter receptor subunit TctC